MESVI